MAEEWSGTGGRSSEDIRREIERTRADMDDTVDELGERLNPGNLIDELWARFRGGDGLSQLGETAREHPVPLALMGLGLGWLAIERSTGGRERRPDVGPGTWARAEGRRGPYGADAVRHDDPDWAHTGTGTKVKAKVAQAGERISEAVREKTGAVADRVRDIKEHATERRHEMEGGASERTGELRERASEAAHHAAEETRERARRAREGFWDLMEENPMVLGAIAFGVGLASGLAAPATPAENRFMGRTADTVKDEARRVAEDTAESAKKVAKDAARAASEEARGLGEEEGGPARSAAQDLKEAATRVVGSAKAAARESAQREDLTPEGIRQEAKGAVQNAREAAKRPGGAEPRRRSEKAGKRSG